MPDIDYRSRSLLGNWVFYQEQYWSDASVYRQWLDFATAAVERVGTQKHHSNAVRALYASSEVEATKEVLLLNKVFGGNIKLDQKNPNFYLLLIKELNHALQLKETYNRALNSLKSGKAYGSSAQYFNTYLIAAWNRRFGKDGQLLTKYITKLMEKSNLTYVQAAEQILDEKIPQVVKSALRDLFKSGDLSKNDKDHSYEVFLQYLDTFHGNELAEQLYQIYHLDQLKQSILDAQNLDGAQSKISDNEIQKTISRNKYSDGGLSLEHFENFCTNIIAENIRGNNYSLKSTHTGKTQIKPDNIITIGIDPSILDNIINNTEKVSRERNAKLMTDLGSQLKNLDDGFIIYSNAKNYSINEGFKSRFGFGAGEAVSVQTFANVLSHFQNIGTLIGAIVNTIPGAINEEGKENLEDLLATDIAYFLFDDVIEIGKINKGVNQLHMFNLDGIFIPLSYLLFELARAIEMGTSNPKAFARVKIEHKGKASKILYPNQPNTGIERWAEQRAVALNNVKISAHFLQNFKELINQL